MGLPKGNRTWEFITSSFADSFLSGHESPYDEVNAGRSRVDDPHGVFAVLNDISEQLRNLVDSIENPSHFYSQLMKQVPKILKNEEIPEEVRGLIKKLIEAVTQDIREIYKNQELPEDEGPVSVSRRVMTDIKQISWVPLNDDEVLDQIQVEDIPVSEIPYLTDLLPQLEMLTEHSGAKGGAARVALKLHVLQDMDLTSPEGETLLESLRAELPLSDLDLVLTKKEPDILAFAEKMGVHPVDVEEIADFEKAALIDHLGRRDLASNQALLTRNRLYYTSSAKEQMRKNSGEAKSVVTNIPGLFGRESFFVQKREYFAANTLYRFVKMVAEGKNTHFVAPRYNFDAIGMGKYWLILVRKWLKRDDRATVFSRAYLCARQMGATKVEAPADFFEELMDEEFDFFSQQTTLDVTKWLMKKYIIFLEKILRRKFGLYPERAGEVFTSQDDREVRIEPDISSVSADEIAAVEDLFAKLERSAPQKEAADSKNQPSAIPEASEGTIIKVLSRFEEKKRAQVGIKEQIIREAQDTGLQIRDSIVYPGFHTVFVLKIEEGLLYFRVYDGTINEMTVPLDALEANCTYERCNEEKGSKRYKLCWVIPENVTPEIVKIVR